MLHKLCDFCDCLHWWHQGESITKWNLKPCKGVGFPDFHKSDFEDLLKTLWNPLIKDICGYTAATAKSLQSCPTLCDPIDGSPPGSHVPGILQGRTLEWVAISFSNAWNWKVKEKSLSRVRLLETLETLRDAGPDAVLHQDCSLPGSSVHGIFQARVLEWGAIAFSDRHL